eukprot:TRINITY_DN5994_c0_g2_i4.p1 TRINITY_DN5994_c0_g2~~TRINITY_DN5994_c0_g2_i4.p1  ORF type:complete len:132 (-),score=19.14 TRINITY_DN5994_c0_g2_i4:441-836(-)
MWPNHCVQGTDGAKLSERLIREPSDPIVRKGTDPDIDSYSAFRDNKGLKTTNLGQLLRQHDIKRVYVCGLATDFCVQYTAFDGLAAGYHVYVIEDACRGIDYAVCRELFTEFEKHGIRVITSDHVPLTLRK